MLVLIRQRTLADQVRKFLLSEGYTVRRLHSVREALHIEETARFELLVTDISVEDAARLMRKDRETRPRRMLLISGEAEYAIGELLDDRTIAAIEKPFAWRELARRVESAILTPKDAGDAEPPGNTSCAA